MVKVIGKPDIDLEKVKRVLILAPHPDDELLGCGGSICALVDAGKDVHVIFLSDGGKSGKPYLRRDEASRVREKLGYNHIEFWDFPDGNLKLYRKEIKEKIRNYALKESVDLILSTAPYDFHEDHRILGVICLELHLEIYPKRFAFYSVYNNILGNLNLDISEYMNKLKDCLSVYEHSLAELDGAEEKFFAVRLFNASVLRLNGKYCESFLLLEEGWNIQEFLSYLLGDYFINKCEFFAYNEVKHVQHIIGYAKYLEDELKKKGKEIETMRCEIDRLEAILKEKENLERELNDIKTSKFYKIAIKYYKIRDLLMPEGSLFRKLYNIFMKK